MEVQTSGNSPAKLQTTSLLLLDHTVESKTRSRRDLSDDLADQIPVGSISSLGNRRKRHRLWAHDDESLFNSGKAQFDLYLILLSRGHYAPFRAY